MKWYTIDEKFPEKSCHILVELDDYTMVSGNMAADDLEGDFFSPDIQKIENDRIEPDQMLRWAYYPEDNLDRVSGIEIAIAIRAISSLMGVSDQTTIRNLMEETERALGKENFNSTVEIMKRQLVRGRSNHDDRKAEA